MAQEEVVHCENGVGISGGLEYPQTEVEFAGAQGEDGVVELASHLQRPPSGARSENFLQGVLGCGFGCADGDGRGASRAIPLHVDIFVMRAGVVGGALQRSQGNAFGISGTVALFSELAGWPRTPSGFVQNMSA